MLPLDKIVKTRDELLARLEPHLKPSERQRQLREQDDLRVRQFIKSTVQRIGEWRFALICGWLGFLGSVGMPSSFELKPLVVLFAVAAMGFGIYKRYFPTVPREDAPAQSGGGGAPSGSGAASPQGKAGIDPSSIESSAEPEKRSTEA